MLNIYVKSAGIRSSSSRIMMSAIKIAICAGTVNSVKGTLPFSDNLSGEIDRVLGLMVDELYSTKERVQRMSSAINEAAALYENTENNRIGNFLVPNLDIIPGFRYLPNIIHFGDRDSGLWEASVGGSVISGSISGGGMFLGMLYGGSAAGSLLNYSASGKVTSGMKLDEDGNITELGIGVEGAASANLAQGELSGNIGRLSGTLSGSVGNAHAEGEIGATLFSDGWLAPAIYMGASAGVSVASGSAEVVYGDDTFNRFINASGNLLGAEAYANGAIGVIPVEGKDGTTSTHFGVQGEVGAEAYVAQGTLSGGFDFCGLKVSVGVTGKAGGAGVKAGGSVTTGGVSGELGLGLGVGGDVSISVDWSQFDPSQAWDTVVDAGESVGEFICDTGEAVGDFINDAGDFIGDVGESVSGFFDDLMS